MQGGTQDDEQRNADGPTTSKGKHTLLNTWRETRNSKQEGDTAEPN